MSKEDWLYQITLDHIASVHSLSLQPILKFTGKIKLPVELDYTGTNTIQIDVAAVDSSKKVMVFAECKDFLTLQSVADCSEQLSMKSFILKNYSPANAIGINQFKFVNLEKYQLIQYISLGSHSGTGYKNAKCSSMDELKRRLDFYLTYLDVINRCYMGLLLYKDKNSPPVCKTGTPRLWDKIA